MDEKQPEKMKVPGKIQILSLKKNKKLPAEEKWVTSQKNPVWARLTGSASTRKPCGNLRSNSLRQISFSPSMRRS